LSENSFIDFIKKMIRFILYLKKDPPDKLLIIDVRELALRINFE